MSKHKRSNRDINMTEQEDILTALNVTKETTDTVNVVSGIDEQFDNDIEDPKPVFDINVQDEQLPPVVTTPQVIEPIKPLVAKTVPVKAVNDIVTLKRFLQDYIDRYVSIRTKYQKDRNDSRLSIQFFGNIINFILKYPEMELLEHVVNFFRTYATTILNPKSALQGIDTVSSQLQHRYSMFYSLMTDAASTKGLKQSDINMGVLEEVFNHPGFIKLLTTYMAKHS